LGWKGNNWEDPKENRGVGQASQESDTELFELVRTLASLVAAEVTLNPRTQNRRMWTQSLSTSLSAARALTVHLSGKRVNQALERWEASH
jgi:hypothetical protein